MCGIAGIFAYHYAALPADRAELGRINAHMHARGPDGQGEWYSGNGRVGLAHRRLAIIDLDQRAAQPMTTTDVECVITFNGEIYNYRALRNELKREGVEFRTSSDTEVLLQLYRRHGVAMLGRLRGMFAFALWDARIGKLLLARDALGIKPLYYADDGWTLRIASQVKALLAGGAISDAREPAGQVGFYLFGSVPEPFTCYQQIRAVPAGSYLWCDSVGASQARSYCTVSSLFGGAPDGPLDEASASEQVRAALQDSVSHHLVADVPVGAFLSGGVDSGALVGVMRDLGAGDFQTVTLRFEEFRNRAADEAPMAAHTAGHYGTRHCTRVVSEDEFQLDLPLILNAMDQPSVDGINSWFVAKAARELGLKVAVSGVGGDELFGGYDGFRRIPNWVRAMRVPALLPGLGKLSRALLAPVLRRQSRFSPKAAGLLEFGGTWEGAYFLKRGLFMPWELPMLLPDDVVEEGLRRLQWANILRDALGREPHDDFARVACLEACFYLRNQLLRDTDWTSMAHSLEVRTPLVDVELWRQLADLAALRREGMGKRLLSHAPLQALPDEIQQRPKTGFTTPIQDWVDKVASAGSARSQARLAGFGPTTWARRLAVAWLDPMVNA